MQAHNTIQAGWGRFGMKVKFILDLVIVFYLAGAKISNSTVYLSGGSFANNGVGNL